MTVIGSRSSQFEFMGEPPVQVTPSEEWVDDHELVRGIENLLELAAAEMTEAAKRGIKFQFNLHLGADKVWRLSSLKAWKEETLLEVTPPNRAMGQGVFPGVLQAAQNKD